jgi:hypothetical protein
MVVSVCAFLIFWQIANPNDMFSIESSDLNTAYNWAFTCQYYPTDVPSNVNIDFNLLGFNSPPLGAVKKGAEMI